MFHVVKGRREIVAPSFPNALQIMRQARYACKIEHENPDYLWEKWHIRTADESYFAYVLPDGTQFSEEDFDAYFAEVHAPHLITISPN